jgi:hypothetical protein
MDSQNRSSAVPRNFDLMSIPGLSSTARDAVNAVFEAMSTWRREVAHNSEKNMSLVMEKMAIAAAELGWPEQVIDAARTQFRSIAEAQMKAMDQIADAWVEQLKQQNSTGLSMTVQKLTPARNSGCLGSWPSAQPFQIGVTNPVQFWMEVAEEWQKSWTGMLTIWTRAGGNAGLRQY